MGADYFTASPPEMEDAPGELVALSIETGTEKIRVMMTIGTAHKMFRQMRFDLDDLIESTRAADVILFGEEGGNVRRHSGKKPLKLTSLGID